MRDDADLATADHATAGLRRLPAAAVAGIRHAFAAEVAERLPRLRQAVSSCDAALLPGAVRDAHALGSSAAVVGEPCASRAARAAEALLLDGSGPAALLAARRPVDELSRHLEGWAP